MHADHHARRPVSAIRRSFRAGLLRTQRLSALRERKSPLLASRSCHCCHPRAVSPKGHAHLVLSQTTCQRGSRKLARAIRHEAARSRRRQRRRSRQFPAPVESRTKVQHSGRIAQPLRRNALPPSGLVPTMASRNGQDMSYRQIPGGRAAGRELPPLSAGLQIMNRVHDRTVTSRTSGYWSQGGSHARLR